MNLIRLGGATLNLTPMDWAGNAATLRSAIAEARSAGVAILCLPELCISGYGCEDAFAGADLRRRCWEQLAALLPETAGMAVCFGLPVLHRNGVFNCVALAVDGKVVGLVAKQHLAGEGLHYEPRWFKPWPVGVRCEIDTPLGRLPMGDLMFEVAGVRIGFEICEDAWVAQRPGASLAARAVDVIMNPSASHFAFGKINVRQRFVLEGSRAFGSAYIYANLMGNEAGRVIYDGGVMIASRGELMVRGPRLSARDWIVTSAVVDLDRQRTEQVRTASFQPEVRVDPLCVEVGGWLPQAAHPRGVAIGIPAWETGPHAKEEEFTRAVSLALFDFLRKSGTAGFVVSLSGGADSAGVIVLVRTMLALAGAELGREGLRAKLPRAPIADGDLDSQVGSILTTVYQSAIGSTESSRQSAQRIAAAIGARHVDLDVGPLVDGYVGLVSKALGRELTWETDDLAMQNIQARVRGPAAWMLANVLGSLLLATSNRSEAAVGYATMDGDTCGGLSPLSGIDKAFLLRWLRWMWQCGPEGVGSIPALAEIISRTPTPELRPASAHQTSEGDLMPYEVLELIEELAIGGKQSPVEVMTSLRAAYPETERLVLVGWVQKFFVLWSRNQWKRERYAPGFHVDDHSLDPKTWCRFPILSGGYAGELADMRANEGGV